MHRSGTSALTEALADAGLKSSRNERVFELNDWILAQHGSSWDRPWLMRRARPRHEELDRVASLWAEMAAEGVTVLTDPRLCLTLGWWSEAWARTGTGVNLVEIVRHPSQVAASLQDRNGIPPTFGEFLWKEYLEQAAENTRGASVHRVWHQELLRDAPRVVGRLTRELGLAPEAPDGSSGGSAPGASVQQSLQHQFSEAPPALWQVRALWAGLRGGSPSAPVGAADADAQTLADAILTQLQQSQTDARQAASARAEYESQLEDIRSAVTGIQDELNRVHTVYAATHAELARVRAAYDASQARLAKFDRSVLGRWLGRSLDKGQ